MRSLIDILSLSTDEIDELIAKADDIIANPERQISTWVGGSLISSLSSFNSICLSQEEYIENGYPIIQRKFF